MMTRVFLFVCSSFTIEQPGSAAPWAFRPLQGPPIPEVGDSSWLKTPVDAFVLSRLEAVGLAPSPPAGRRVFIRRVTYDLTGLPPDPEEVAAFLADRQPGAEERLVDRLLASPAYGERWARHWMDVVHYAESHGHDEDALRPNAWPYRDYLVGAFNRDLPYPRFIREQVAGDVFFPDEPEAVVATGMLAAGPWDSSSQMGIQDGTSDKDVARYLDRDDMLATVMSTFTSTSAHCARCHDHKFDPVSQEDYYALQAVFAGVDRVDRPYDPDPGVHRLRRKLRREKAELDAGHLPPGPDLSEGLPRRLAAWESEFRSAQMDWVTVRPEKVDSSGGATLEIMDDGSIYSGGARPEVDTLTVSVRAPPGRVTAVQLEVLTDGRLPHKGPGRQDNGNLHLSEFTLAAAGDGGTLQPLALATPTADFNQGGWTIAMAVDGDPKTAWGIYPKVGEPHRAVFPLRQPLEIGAGGLLLTATLKQLHGGGHLIGRARLSVTGAPHPRLSAPVPTEVAAALDTAEGERTVAQRHTLALFFLRRENTRRLEALPPPAQVYAVATDFAAKGNFKPARGPRPVHFLRRGNIHQKGEPAQPGALSALPGPAARFALDDPEDEGARRAALADWLAHRDNVLTWRSIANRVWHYHAGRGIVATPNDFGGLGEAPSHPDLLDWMAAGLRRRGGSLKWLHRVILNSATYRQSARGRPGPATADAGNRLLWRMNRQRLGAEAVRDSLLHLAGVIDRRMGGPAVDQFHSSKGIHITPVIDYLGFDPDAPAGRRRAVYRTVVRTVPDPFMRALDCPDAGQLTPRRSSSFTPQQALALLHSPLAIRAGEHLAARLELEVQGDLESRVDALFIRALARLPSPLEGASTLAYARRHGLANACRMVLNSNAFLFLE